MSACPPRPDAALLFDLDGTLVDTREVNWRSYRDSLAELGIACRRADFDRHFGAHWRDFLPLLAGSGDPGLLACLHRRKQEIYPRHLGAARLNFRLAGLLRRARAGRRIGLVTTASRASVAAVLAHVGLADAFECIVTGDDVARPKPAPDGYLACLAALNARAQASVAFEDSPTGVAAARAAGLAVVVVEDFAPCAGPVRSLRNLPRGALAHQLPAHPAAPHPAQRAAHAPVSRPARGSPSGPHPRDFPRPVR
jgi:HAD superfamily hydrolase (TIGR01509 family)